MAAASVAAAVLASAPRDGLKFAGAILAAVAAPVVLVVLVAAVWLGTLLPGTAHAGSGGALGAAEHSQPPSVPSTHLAVMRDASRASGVPWELLAAVASVESGFGANMATSWAGAIGYGQFMPPSWAAYGNGGDPYDYRDAIPAMARYLADHGAPADLPKAVYGYNHSWEYVALVLGRMAVYVAHGPDPGTTRIPAVAGGAR